MLGNYCIIKNFKNMADNSGGMALRVFFNKKIIWFKPSRTAGSSLTREISTNYIHEWDIKKCIDENIGHQHVNLFTKLTDEEIINNYWKFIIVRNPFDRLVSAWKWSIRALNMEKNISFEKFVKSKIVDKDNNFTNPHWSLQITGGEYKGKMLYDYIGRFEDLPESWNYISRAFGKTPSLHTIVNQTTDPKFKEKDSYKKHYTDELIEITSKIYKKDLEAFNYEF
jgi:hypothetical protein|tara:strand:+ start:1991 stop:2665 length:675 start_codon:yes stop_codon:yes gene_type:complete